MTEPAAIRVLIVEDRPEDAELMAHELRRSGFDVRYQRVDVADEFAAALATQPDLILSDYNMPQFSGAHALSILRESGLDIPMIVVTGSISEEVAVDCMKQGASDYLLKDRLTRLGQAARTALEQKRSRDNERAAVQSVRAYADTQRLLLQELDHRVRNNLTALLSLIDMTRRSVGNVDAFADSIGGRVRAMAGVHSLLSQSRWGALHLEVLIAAVIPTGRAKQIDANGPDLKIPSRQVTGMAMVLHELMINSVKHGALSVPAGRVKLEWRVVDSGDGSQALTLRWRESGGPPVPADCNRGVGIELIEGLVRTELRGDVRLSFPRDGADHVITARLDERDEQPDAESLRTVHDAPV
jgi:two-component sensor histidine kinase